MRRFLLAFSLLGCATACVTSSPIHPGEGGTGGGLPSYGGFGGEPLGFGGSSEGKGGFGGSFDETSTDVSTGTGSFCGDGTCDPNEDCKSCSQDCACNPTCGDGNCDADEDCQSCPEDCGKCPVCGDGTCDPTETCKTCYQDCGVCPCKADSKEPDDSSLKASPATSGTKYCDLSICSGDVDWFSFTITHGFDATITFAEGQGDLDLEIYSKATGDYVSGSYSSDDNEEVSMSTTAGTYWARVYGKKVNNVVAVNPSYCFEVTTN